MRVPKTVEEYICPDCGFNFMVYRLPQARREKGHIKDLYCPFCDEDKGFIESSKFKFNFLDSKSRFISPKRPKIVYTTTVSDYSTTTTTTTTLPVDK